MRKLIAIAQECTIACTRIILIISTLQFMFRNVLGLVSGGSHIKTLNGDKSGPE